MAGKAQTVSEDLVRRPRSVRITLRSRSTATSHMLIPKTARSSPMNSVRPGLFRLWVLVLMAEP